ncbi:hypothetical protein F4808DRAFT_455663 [Astrocystis sublimbata]|nr:hypothetical protein F4808DRAFT_455663 [Astrocystis sublimbata]
MASATIMTIMSVVVSRRICRATTLVRIGHCDVGHLEATGRSTDGRIPSVFSFPSHVSRSHARTPASAGAGWLAGWLDPYKNAQGARGVWLAGWKAGGWTERSMDGDA